MEQEFPYSQGAASMKTRIVVTGFLFLSAAFFLWKGNSPFLFEPRDLRFSDDQNLILNRFSSCVLLVLGFLNLFRIWGTKPGSVPSVVVSQNRVVAPNQGFSGRTVKIAFKDITRLQKLSVDGIWEFNVFSRDKQIRVPKVSLERPGDFDRMIDQVLQLTSNCTLEIEERIDPPTLDT